MNLRGGRATAEKSVNRGIREIRQQSLGPERCESFTGETAGQCPFKKSFISIEKSIPVRLRNISVWIYTVSSENFISFRKMLESRSEDALVLLVKLVKSTVMTVETVETVESVESV